MGCKISRLTEPHKPLLSSRHTARHRSQDLDLFLSTVCVTLSVHSISQLSSFSLGENHSIPLTTAQWQKLNWHNLPQYSVIIPSLLCMAQRYIQLKLMIFNNMSSATCHQLCNFGWILTAYRINYVSNKQIVDTVTIWKYCIWKKQQCKHCALFQTIWATTKLNASASSGLLDPILYLFSQE